MSSSHQEANAAVNIRSNEDELWHRRFGHLNYGDLRAMKKNHNVIGTDFKEIDQIRNCKVCKVCLAAKLPRQPFPTRIGHMEFPIHSVLMG